MSKPKIACVCLLSFCLCGCPELTSNPSPKPRSGSLGITADGLDDMAKPDPKPAQSPANNGQGDPNARK